MKHWIRGQAYHLLKQVGLILAFDANIEFNHK